MKNAKRKNPVEVGDSVSGGVQSVAHFKSTTLKTGQRIVIWVNTLLYNVLMLATAILWIAIIVAVSYIDYYLLLTTLSEMTTINMSLFILLNVLVTYMIMKLRRELDGKEHPNYFGRRRV